MESILFIIHTLRLHVQPQTDVVLWAEKVRPSIPGGLATLNDVAALLRQTHIPVW